MLAYQHYGCQSTQSPSGYRGIEPIITHIEGSVSGSFQDKWGDRCLNENAINPAVYASNVSFLSGEDACKALARKRGGSWNQIAVFTSENGQFWQGKFDVPQYASDGKLVKYAAPKNSGTRLFRPAVPIETRVLMSKMWGVDVPLSGSFWDWFSQSDEALKLPLVATEGGTKALSIVSLGIPSVSFYGVSSAFQSKKVGGNPKLLLPEFRDAARGRNVYFAFDQDIKEETRSDVRAAIYKTGKALEVVSQSVHVMGWDPGLGKGADDFIAANGSEAFLGLIKDAQEFKPWSLTSSIRYKSGQRAKLSARAVPDISADAPTMTDCHFPIPQLSHCLLLSGAMGLGKTHEFGRIASALKKLHPDMFVDAIGHRNNLLKQTSTRLGLLHIHALACGSQTYARMASEREMAYCIDSLWRRSYVLMEAIERGEKVLLVLDEIDAVLKHLTTSATIRPARRIEIINKFSILLKAIAAGGGWVIGGEANLSALSVQALKDLSGGTLKITVAENTRKPAPWDCFVIEPPAGKAATASAMKRAAIALINLLVSEGKRVLVLTTSQNTCEAIEGIYKRLGVKTERIDSKNSSEKWQQAVLENAGPELEKAQLGILVGSPSIECGLSIEGENLFDAIVLYSGNLEPSVCYQMLGRLRDATVPRFLCVADQSQQSFSAEINPDKILDSWRKKTYSVLSAHNFQGEIQTPIVAAHKIAANYDARASLGASDLKQGLLDLLRFDQHKLIHFEVELDGSEKPTLQEASEIDRVQRMQEWLNADDSELSPELARERLKESSLNWLDKVCCLKALNREINKNLVDQPEWVDLYWGQESEGKRLKNAHLLSAEYSREGMSAESDRRAAERVLRSSGTIWGRDVQARDLKIQTLKKINVDGLLSIAGEDSWIHGEHPLVQNLLSNALLIPDEVKQNLGLLIKGTTKPMAFVTDLLRKFGYSFESKKITVPQLIPVEGVSCPSKTPIGLLGDFRGQETPTVSNSPSKIGRPKGPETLRVTVYRLIPSEFHDEMLENLVTHHNNYRDDLEVDRSPFQPGRSVTRGETAELWTVTAKIGRTIFISKGSEVLPIGDCQKIDRDVLELDCQALPYRTDDDFDSSLNAVHAYEYIPEASPNEWTAPELKEPTVQAAAVDLFDEGWWDFIRCERTKNYSPSAIESLKNQMHYVPSEVWAAITAP